MIKIIQLTILIFSVAIVNAQNVGINQPNPTNSLHITPISIGDNPLKIEGVQAYTVGDTSILVINPTTGVVKYMNASELSSSILNSTIITNIADSLLNNNTFINNFGDSLLNNNTFINNFGDSLFLSQSFTDSLTSHLYNNGDTLLYNSSFINSLKDSIDTDVDSLTLIGTLLTIYENGNSASVNLSSLSDNDGDPTNEIELPSSAVLGQVLTWDGSNWIAQNAASGADNWGTQAVVSGTGFSGNGTSGTPLNYTEADGSITNELQTLSSSGSNISLSNSGGTVSINDADSNPANEYNTSISLSGNTLSILDGGGTISIDLTPLINTAVSNAVPPGTINAYAGSSAPTGYLFCDGSAVSRTTYSDLFTAIGTIYGSGNGSTTFNLPNYTGQFLRGIDNGQGTDLDAATRTDRGDGTTGDVVGTKQTNQTLAHNHSVNPPATNSNSNGAHAHSINPPSTSSNTAGNHAHSVDPPNTNTNATGNHAHSIDPPNTNSTTAGNHAHSVNPPNTNTTASGSHHHGNGWGERSSEGTPHYGFFAGAPNNQRGSNGGMDNDNSQGRTSTVGNHSHAVNIGAFNSSAAGNHAHSVNIPAFNSNTTGNHAHSVNIPAFNSNTTGNHSHTTDIPAFNSSNTGNHTHSTNIPAFNSASNGGNETRPTNISVLWCIKF